MKSTPSSAVQRGTVSKPANSGKSSDRNDTTAGRRETENRTSRDEALIDALPESARDPSSGVDVQEEIAARTDPTPESESEGGFNVRKVVEHGVDLAETELEQRARRLRSDS